MLIFKVNSNNIGRICIAKSLHCSTALIQMANTPEYVITLGFTFLTQKNTCMLNYVALYLGICKVLLFLQPVHSSVFEDLHKRRPFTVQNAVIVTEYTSM
jgi:hypothetical protein